MELKITSNRMNTAQNLAFGIKNTANLKPMQEKTGEFISKAGAAAITAAASIGISKINQQEKNLPAPTIEKLTEDIKEPVYVDGKIIFNPENCDKISNFEFLKQKFSESGVTAFLKVNNSEAEGVINLEVDYDKYRGGMILSFDLPQKNNIKYTMFLNDKGEIQELRKKTRIKLDSKYNYSEELIKDEVFSKRKPSKIEYFSRDKEIGIEFGVGDKEKAFKYIDNEAYLNKHLTKPYDGEINDKAMIEYFTKYVNGEID